MTLPDLSSGLVYYIVFLFSTTLHESAHAWAAKLGGDLTAYHGGQVSLDPTAHIRREPIGMVVLPILSIIVSGWPFGFASAPYDPRWELRHPKRAAWMALAGPGANLLLVILAFLCIRAGFYAGIFHPPDSARFGHLVGTDAGGLWGGVAFTLSVFFSMNLVLALLNVIPLPPLDGSTGIIVLLSASAATRYVMWLQENRTLAIFGMLIAWRIFDEIFDPVFWTAVNLIYPGISYG